MPGENQPAHDELSAADLLALAREESLRNMSVPFPGGAPVPRRISTISRVFSGGLIAGYLHWMDVEPARLALWLLLPLVVAWFPNAIAAATGRLSAAWRVIRASSPRPLLAMAWLWLLFPVWVRPIVGWIVG